MPIVPLLPPLGPNFKTPTHSGKWQIEDNRSFIKAVAEAVSVQGVPDDARNEISIPDVWAPIKLFEGALRNPDHVLHSRAKAEWRGLLAMLATAEFRSLDISVRRLPVPQRLRMGEGSVPPMPAGFHNSGGTFHVPGVGIGPVRMGRFATVAGKLRPQEQTALFRDQTWEEIGRVHYRGRFVAFIIPSVIVAPVRGYETLLDKRIAWTSDDGTLIDPATARAVRDEDVAIIRRYCGQLRDRLVQLTQQANDRERLGAIVRELQQYETDLGLRLQTEFGDDAFSPKAANWDMPPLPYNDALKTQFVIKTGRRYSTCLKPRQPFTDLFEGALLVDSTLARLLSEDPRDIVIWYADTLDRVERADERREAIRVDAAEAGFLMLACDDLFTPDLCELEGGAEISTHNPSCRRFVLPIQPILLLFMSPEDIYHSVTIRSHSDGYVVQLQIRVCDEKGRQRPCVVEKSYNRAVTIGQPLNLSAWPNFKTDDWPYYFLFSALNPEEALKPIAAFSVEAAQAVLRQSDRSQDRVAYARDVGTFIALNTSVKPIENLPSAYCGLHRLPQFPEAVVCEAMLPGSQPNERTPIVVGTILFPTHVGKPEMSLEAMRVGIDFGSTNTTAYFTLGTSSPQEMSFLNRAVTPFASRREGGEMQHALEFLPLDEVRIPFLTILEERREPEVTKEEPLWSDRIHYVPNASEMAIRLINQGRLLAADRGGRALERLWFNLKWGTEERVRRKVLLFLAQVALQALAEATARGITIDRVRWAFSYPQEAFSQEQRENFESLCHIAISLARGRKGAAPTGEPMPIVFQPESLCTARYFAARRKAFFTGSVLTIDVGGGTTDILLSQHQKGIWRSSLKFAGRNILIDYLSANPVFLERLAGQNRSVRDAVEKLKDLDHHQHNDVRMHAVEVLVNTKWYQDEFQNQFPVLNSDDSSGGPRLARLAALCLGGVLYYVAQVINYLSQPTASHPSPPFQKISGERLRICLGGKGSLVFRMAVGRDATTKILKMFQTVAKLPDAPQDIAYSDHAKHEVAHGLLVEGLGAAAELDLDSAMSEAILGEAMVVDGKVLSPLSLPPRSILSTPWRLKGLPEIRQMLTAFEKATGKRVRLDNATEDGLCDGLFAELETRRGEMLNDDYHHRRAQESEWLEVEPVYVMALRALIAHLVRDERGIA